VLLQAQLYLILELCRAFDKIFKEHLDGGYYICISSLSIGCVDLFLRVF
jgi:hypothetical protein